MEDEPKYKSRIFEIVPNTKRNQELRAKKLAEENQKRQEDEKVCLVSSYSVKFFANRKKKQPKSKSIN